MTRSYRLVLFSAIFATCSLPFSLRAQQQNSGDGDAETLSAPVKLPPPVGIYKELQSTPERIRQSAPFARALEEMTKRAGADGTYDVEARIAAFQQSQRDLVHSARAAEQTLSLGGETPLSNAWTNIGLVGSSSNGVFSAGCTTALAVDSVNPNIVYAGATSGGVWKSTNAGASWAELTDIVIPNLSVASIAIDPKHHNTLYVGTGNGYASFDELTGTGIYKSTDGGGTWTHLAPSTITGSVVKVLVDPVHSNVVFASLYPNGLYSSNRGVYRSTDSGASWTKVYTGAQPVWDIVAGTEFGGTPYLYFAEGNNVYNNSSECGIYKSLNDGVTWTRISSSTFPPADSFGRCALAASVTHPERIFMLVADPLGDEIDASHALYRSTDNGVTWSTITIPSTLFLAQNPAPQGWYDCVLGVTPNSHANADTIYIGGIEAYVNYSDGTGWNAYSLSGLNTAAAHVDHHSIAFNRNDPSVVYDGCDGGVYWSQDAGYADLNSGITTWGYRSSGMVTNRVYRIGLSPSDSKTTIAGLQDQGIWQIVNGGSTVVNASVGGDGSQSIISPASSNTIYSQIAGGAVWKSTNGFSGTFNSVNYPIFPNGPLSAAIDYSLFDPPFKMSCTSLLGNAASNVLYRGRTHLWRTTDGGTFWDSITSEYNYPISAIGISEANSQDLYIGFQYGGIQRTTNAGANWTDITTGTPGNINWVSSIVTSWRDTNFVLASFYTKPGSSLARVMRSTDKGAHWSNFSGGTSAPLPLVGVSCVALDSVDPLRIWYAATDNGIYYTLDSGAHWSIAGAGIGLAPCTDVQIQANKTTIRVATFGRGIWEANTGTLPVELAGFTYQKIQNANLIGTQLSWHTDSEHGSAFFVVERSIDGAAFEDLSPSIPSKAPGGTSSTMLDYAFFDSTHAAGDYIYQLKQIDLDGSVHFSNAVELHWGQSGLIVSQNYPNPFVIGTPSSTSGFNPFGSNQDIIVSPWPTTRIHYELPDADVVTIKIYNSTGSLTRTLLDHAQQSPGDPDVFWDGRQDDGSFAASGTYFYVVETAHYGTVVNKLVLISN